MEELHINFYIAVSAAAGVIASLASLMSLFRETPSKANIRIFRSVIRYCSVLLIASLLPLVLVAGSLAAGDWIADVLQPATVWRICSAVYAIALLFLMRMEFQVDNRDKIYDKNRSMFWISLCISLVMILAAGYNILVDQNQFWLMLGILWALSVTALQLYMLLVGVTEAYLHEEKRARITGTNETVVVCSGNRNRHLGHADPDTTQVHEYEVIASEDYDNSNPPRNYIND